MPLHDWTRVDAGILHHFHNGWITRLSDALNDGILSADYYALAEQHAGSKIADVLTLHANPPTSPPPSTSGGIAVAEAPPQVRRKQVMEDTLLARRRSLAIRHVSGHRLIALLEIVSPASKDRHENIESFVGKVVSALRAGVHLLVVDMFPPSPHDPQGIHGEVCRWLENPPYDLPLDEPFTLVSYAADHSVYAYLEHLAAGDLVPEMPLFLTPDRYVNVPLGATYEAAFRGVPAFWRNVLEGPSGRV